MITSADIILITGGTGSFGNALVDKLLSLPSPPNKIIIYSRDELKQYDMANKYENHDTLRFFIGDVRDKERLSKALKGVDTVFHAAALKQVPACEYNPEEAVKTNILGSMNLIDTCIENKVRKVVALSSDKAVHPVNLYGATKLVSEKLFVSANAQGNRETRFVVVRYGNVLASRGSVLQLFKEQLKTGTLTITDPYMTRFWWTLPEAVQFVIDVHIHSTGGEIYVPPIQSTDMGTFAKAVIVRYGNKSKACNFKITGTRPGEKVHEVLIASDEASRTHDFGWCYIVFPSLKFFSIDTHHQCPVLEQFTYTSDKHFMTVDDLVLKFTSLDSC